MLLSCEPTPLLLTQKRIEELLQNGPGDGAGACREFLSLVDDHVGWRGLHWDLHPEIVIGVDGGVESAGLYGGRAGWLIPAPSHKLLNSLEFGSGHGGCDIFFDVTVGRPRVLIVIQSRFDILELTDAGRSVDPARGLVAVFVHGEREIAMDKINLSAGHVVVDHGTESIFVKIAARGAFVIAEYFHGDGGAARSIAFQRRTRTFDAPRTSAFGGHGSRMRALAGGQRYKRETEDSSCRESAQCSEAFRRFFRRIRAR